MTFDPSQDFADVIDAAEAVTLVPRGGSASTAIAHALPRAVSTRESIASNGQYTTADVRWHLPVTECAAQPAIGDVILDGDCVRWTVMEVQKATVGTRWVCTCRDVAIAYGLSDTITILRATYAKGDGGATEPTWTTWKTGVRARIQPEQAEMAVELDLRHTVRRVAIYVAEQLELDHRHRIKAQDGTVYKVTGYTAAERVGELETIAAEETPWPLN